MSKEDILKANGTYNRSHGKVTAEKFLTGGFYDPMDIIQVKYEMLREALESPHRNITEPFNQLRSAFSFLKVSELSCNGSPVGTARELFTRFSSF